MKLKKQFLRLFALLGLSMAATSAWAAEVAANPPSQFVCDGNGDNCFVNMPTPSSSAEVVVGSVTIPSNVKTFKVYDDGGADNPFSSFSGTGEARGVRLLLNGPAGSKLKVSGRLYGAATGQRPYVIVIDKDVYSGSTNDYITYGHTLSTAGSVFNINGKGNESTGSSILVQLHSDGGSGSPNGAGLDMTVEVLPGTLTIDPSENGSYNVSSAAGQFDLQIPAGSVNNTTTLTAPAGYVLYVEGGIAVPSGSTVTAYDGANTSANQLFATTGASNTASALSSTNSVTIQVATTGSGFAAAQNVTVHVLKKNTSVSSAAIEIYEQDNSTYKVAKVNDVESGSVSISSINVNAIEFNRTFTAGTPSTIVLPFQLPDNATTNAKFYYLKNVAKVDCKWVATFRNIKLDNTNALPAANTPYGVIVPQGTELQFNLNGEQATFLTGEIKGQYDDSGDWIFKGTYVYKAWETESDGIGLDYAIAKTAGDGYVAGDFVKVGEGSSAAPMRAYMSKASSSVRLGRPLAMGEVSSIESLPESIDVEFIDEEEKTTAIGRMNTVTGAIKIDRWFDLKGRSTNHKPTTKGAFFNKKGIAK